MRLFDESALRKLEQLALAADSIRVGVLKGNRRSHKRGTSVEFADYRDYAQGDDLRRLDWNVFARLEKPFIKLTQEEEDLAVHILVDTSESMDWPQDEPEPAFNKLRYAMQLAGGLGYVGLLAGDLVSVSLFDTSKKQSWGPFRGRQNSWPLLQFLNANYELLTSVSGSAARNTALNLSLRDYALRARRPGLLFLLSDLLSVGDYRDGLAALLARGYEIALLQLLSPDEEYPELSGDLKLIDIESGEAAEVTLDPVILDEYRQRLEEWQAGIRDFCVPRGIHFTPILTDIHWDQIITQTLRREGVVR